MDTVKFYCDSKPKNGEIVQVIFTERSEDHAIGYLTEYNGEIIMPFSQATKKRRIRSINKLIPLDKQMAVIIEDFNDSKLHGNVSRAYLEDADENFTNKFSTNYKLFNGIFQICEQTKTEFSELWKTKIFPFISNIESNDDETFLEQFVSKIDDLDKLISNKDLLEKIKEKFQNTTTKKEVYKKKIGIISNDGVTSTKNLIYTSLNHPSVNEYKDDISIKYFSTPNYMIETDTSNEVLDEFVKLIQENSKKMKNIFVKVY